MANENKQGLLITTNTNRRTGFGQVNPDVDDDLTPAPMPRPRHHNSDGHHHHEHSHDDDVLSGEEQDTVDDGPGPGDLIELYNFQSENFITNTIFVTDTDSDAGSPQILSLKDLGVDDDSSYETATSIASLLNTYPTEGDNSILRLAIEPIFDGEELLVGPYTLPRVLELRPELIPSDNTNADHLMSLPFPQFVEEFDINEDGSVSNTDGISWHAVGRPDINVFVTAYVLGGTQAIITLQNYENNTGYTFTTEQYTQVETQTIPSVNGNDDLLNPFSYYYNVSSGRYFFEIQIQNIGFEIGVNTDSSFPNTRFKLIGPQVEYQDIQFDPIEEDEDIIEEDEDIIEEDITLIDNSSEDEEISDEFGLGDDYDNVIEQTLYRSFDPFSALDVNSALFQNDEFTDTRLSQINTDKRISLGMFSFDDENTLQDNFPDVIRNTKFRQVIKQNLVPNPRGQSFKSVYKNKSSDTQSLSLGNDQRERFFIPEGGWGYCTYDAVGPDFRKRNIDLYEGGTDQFYDYIENEPNGQALIDSFEQSENGGLNDSGETTIDPQNVIGYAGYYPYFFDYKTGRNQSNSLIRLQSNLISGSFFAEGEVDGEYNLCNKLFMLNQIDSFGIANEYGAPSDSVSTHESRLTCYKCRAIGRQEPSDYDVEQSIPDIYFPNFARWVITDEAYSFNRCLEFLATNYVNGMCDFNDNGTRDTEIEADFSWMSDYNMNTNNGGQLNNQYRSLNQVIKIYNPYQDTVINPFTVMEVKFKMKTLDFFYDANNPPMVEIAIVDSDGYVGAPDRIEDTVNGDNEDAYSRRHGYWPHGDFNSTRYSDDLNTENTLDTKYSNFGSMGRFKNTEVNVWETFSYKFTLAHVFRYGSGIIRPLYLIVQAGNDFIGRVLLDEFEVYDSGDFIPEVDVRKKISVGNYGTADLTKYYDKELQPEEYKDSQGPLEAQFYFYPMYPTDEIFDVKRTPVYQDFKKGLFYIYDVDWGDGSKNEFTREPVQIDEETALYHTYESSGVFEITGTMLRIKLDNRGREVGVLKNKKFKLRININEGTAEDFKYFGSDGFSFIPFKNTLPIIGGISKQSIYYKSLKRFNGFIDDEQTNIGFKSKGDKLKTQIAFDRMDSSFSSNFNLLNEYKKPRFDLVYDENNNPIDSIDIYNGIQTNSEELGKSIGDCDLTNVKYYNEPKSIWELFGFEEDDLEQIGTPNNPRYWKNIIPEDYSIYKRQGINFSPPTQLKEFYELDEVLSPEYFSGLTMGWLVCAQDDENCQNKYVNGAEAYAFQELQYDTPEWECSGDTGPPHYDCDNINKIYPNINYNLMTFVSGTVEFCHPLLGCTGFNKGEGIMLEGPMNYDQFDFNVIYTGPFMSFNLSTLVVNTYSEQEWLNGSYYPVLPRYGQDGNFIEGDFPNDNIPFPIQGQITDENETNQNLIINITREQIEPNTFSDNSGNQNLGFGIVDYKPEFDNETLQPKKKRSIDLIKSSTNNGAF
jgi:hypothetical protein